MNNSKRFFNSIIISALYLFASFTTAIELDPTSRDSICNALTLVLDGTLNYYEGFKYGGTIGMFTSPYYWWEAGEAWGGIIDTWYFCQNDTYEQVIMDALLHQVGQGNDYIPANQSMTEGNDDQAFWGLAVMGATERNFTNPPPDQPQWLALTQAVYNTMWSRWDTSNCDGGLRWQIFTWNSGYNYKNTISNGCLMHIAARLARYTGNETYVDTATTVWDWMANDVDFLVLENDAYQVRDGADIGDGNCTKLTRIQWSYNAGIVMAGCAYLYDFTNDTVWLTRTTQLFNGIHIFFTDDNIMYEQFCQPRGTCNNDQRSFKSVFSRCLGMTAKLIPSLHDKIMTLLTASAVAAAQSCTGGTDGHTCGLAWNYNGWDGFYGLGEQISALEVMNNLLIDDRPGPFTNRSGGSSVGNADAGLDSKIVTNPNEITITNGDKAGAGFITAIVLIVIISICFWMLL
ncbi:unnamed protein product [[Candida] boidinii]|uniref:Mannan endo-1,6-alpha-mannosidase n=1 Tax=Candida boidinii TaxID=5477 RepID=A0A9W6SY74_CANBO|nr:hypothetical protein B5S30_g989 [[Candida] boidinii]GME69660.1 unnamed protein product [[Candida] boidinii]GMG06196.1 unnamed protein product [[Candida] boidinii]